MPEHVNAMTGPIISWMCTIYSTHSRYVRVWVHKTVRTPLENFLVEPAFSGSSTFTGHPLELVIITTALCKT